MLGYLFGCLEFNGMLKLIFHESGLLAGRLRGMKPIRGRVCMTLFDLGDGICFPGPREAMFLETFPPKFF